MEKTIKAEQSTIDDLMTMDQVCKLLGRTKPAIYTMICRGQLQSYKWGGRHYFFKSKLIEAITSGS